MEVNNASVEDTPELTQGLTCEEDDELRRLHYFQQFGPLAGEKAERFIELRLRDRRATIRQPREFIVEEHKPEAKKAGWRVLWCQRRS